MRSPLTATLEIPMRTVTRFALAAVIAGTAAACADPSGPIKLRDAALRPSFDVVFKYACPAPFEGPYAREAPEAQAADHNGNGQACFMNVVKEDPTTGERVVAEV